MMPRGAPHRPPGISAKGSTSARRHPRRLAGTGRRRADVLVPARGRRRPRHQDRAAGGRFRARLRRAGAGPEHAISSGSTAARNRSVLDLTKPDDKALLEAMLGQGRRVHPEPQARRGGQARLCRRAAAPRLPAADRLLGVGLRRQRALRRAQGLRHADPGRGRRRLGHRRAGGAGPRRRLGLRHRRRHERLRGGAGGADRARPHRRGRGDLGVDVRRHGGLDDDAAAATRGRRAAEAHRPRAHLDLALRRVQDPRTAPTF